MQGRGVQREPIEEEEDEEPFEDSKEEYDIDINKGKKKKKKGVMLAFIVTVTNPTSRDGDSSNNEEALAVRQYDERYGSDDEMRTEELFIKKTPVSSKKPRMFL